MDRRIAIGAILAAGCTGQAERQPALFAPAKVEVRAVLPPPRIEPIVTEEVEIRGEKDALSIALRRPSIGVIGASDVWPGTIAKELQKILSQKIPEATANSYGIGGQGSTQILARFKRQIIDNGHNIAVLSGLTIVNEVYPEVIRENYAKMFDMARENGIAVVVYNVSPFGGFGKWSPKMQKKADDFNEWLTGCDGIALVDVSSLGTPAWPGGPLKLRSEFDSGDGIHPSTMGEHETAKLIFESALRLRMD